MKNSEKYKTAKEWSEAFEKFCDRDCAYCNLDETYGLKYCIFQWLELEAEDEKLLPCPYCGREVRTVKVDNVGYRTYCTDISRCGYQSTLKDTLDDAVSVHSELVKRMENGRKQSNLDKLLEVCSKTCPDNHGYEHKCGHCRTKELLDNLRRVEDEISEYKHRICGGW